MSKAPDAPDIVGFWCNHCGDCYDGLPEAAGRGCPTCGNGSLQPSEFIKASKLL